MKVLIVEDDANCVRFIKLAIDSLCREIVQTDMLHRALQILDGSFDAVWLDLSLLDSSAYNTIGHIPEIRKASPNATLIVVSGYGDAYRQKAMDAGADVYASKMDLGDFNRDAIAAIFIQAAVHAMGRGIPANKVLEKVVSFFGQRICAMKESVGA